MTTRGIQANLELRFKEATEENELLLRQLLQVQEDLEDYYLRNEALKTAKPVESRTSIVFNKGWANDEVLDVVAENQRLRVLIEVQKEVHLLETQNALKAKLGEILIQGTDSPKALLTLPGKLGRVWRTYNRMTPPESLGGKGFGKVLSAYDEGGFDAVEKLMAGAPISTTVMANGYTVLARQLMYGDSRNAAEAARRAYSLDPKPFRLKWLAFRLREAGQSVEAQAMLDILPAGIEFSESEARQVKELRDEANRILQQEAMRKTDFSERRAEVETQLHRLARERDEKAQLAAVHSLEIEALKRAKAQLEQEKSILASQCGAAVKQAADHTGAVQTLMKEKAELEQANAKLARECAGADKRSAERVRAIEALKQEKAQSEREKSAFADQCEALMGQMAGRIQTVETLTQEKAQLEREKSALANHYAEAVAQAAEYLKQLEALRRQVESRKACEAELAARQQLMQEEMVRAEAQLDLIKDMFLREPGL